MFPSNTFWKWSVAKGEGRRLWSSAEEAHDTSRLTTLSQSPSVSLFHTLPMHHLSNSLSLAPCSCQEPHPKGGGGCCQLDWLHGAVAARDEWNSFSGWALCTKLWWMASATELIRSPYVKTMPWPTKWLKACSANALHPLWCGCGAMAHWRQ
jgi:hypothetical protein